MECFLINLDSQPDRHEFVQRNFAEYKAPGWFLTRIQAADKAFINRTGVKGVIRDGEKGCFVSHQRALEASLEAPGHAMILEDDVMFGPGSCAAVARAMEQLPGDGWDLLFTDLSIYFAPLMVALLQQRRELARDSGQALINMGEIPFCGSTAYVVNKRSKQRVLELIGVETLDSPYDVFLRNLIRAEQIRSLVTFPFATTLSPLGDDSSIQIDADTERVVLNAFRRLVWVDRDLGQVDQDLSRLGANAIDAESATFSRLIGSTFSIQISGFR